MSFRLFLYLGICIGAVFAKPSMGLAEETQQTFWNSDILVGPIIAKLGGEVHFVPRETSLPEGARFEVEILDSAGRKILKQSVTGADSEKKPLLSWQPTGQGFYTVRVSKTTDDGATAICEREVAVISPERPVYLAWYGFDPVIEWANVITTVTPEVAELLEKSGVKGLQWQVGGMNYNFNGAGEMDDETFSTAVEKGLLTAYTAESAHAGMGLDEFGGYPGSRQELGSIAGGRALDRARETHPERFFAVWHGGGIREPILASYRRSVDLLLLQSYVFRAMPEHLGTENIYQTIDSRLLPLLRASDMLLPAYGNRLHTLVAIDTSERPDLIELGEMENAVRHIRRQYPEIRGMAWYNGGFSENSPWGLKTIDEVMHKKHDDVIAKANSLNKSYFLSPCVTLQNQAIWFDSLTNEIVVAVSNIGSMDAGEVEITLTLNDKKLGAVTKAAIPAGASRNSNRAFFRFPLQGDHPRHGTAKATISKAEGATLLDQSQTSELNLTSKNLKTESR